MHFEDLSPEMQEKAKACTTEYREDPDSHVLAREWLKGTWPI